MDEYIPVKEAAAILRVSERQVQKHAASGRVQSRTEGRRLLLLREDVEKLAEELGSDHKKEPVMSAELVPDTGEFMDFVRDLQHQLLVTTRRVGVLEGQLELRALPEDLESLREQVAELRVTTRIVEEERDRLREELEQKQKAWWKRLFT